MKKKSKQELLVVKNAHTTAELKEKGKRFLEQKSAYLTLEEVLEKESAAQPAN